MSRSAARAVALVLAAPFLAGGCTGGGDSSASVRAPAAECGQSATHGAARPDPARQPRGMWIATVANVDWPSARGCRRPSRRPSTVRLLDTARALHLNAVFVQVRPSGDALYPSRYEPWSQ